MGAGKLGPWASWAVQVLELRQAGSILSGTFRKMGWGSARGLEGRRSRDAVRQAGEGCTSGRGWEAPDPGRTQPFLWLLSGNGESWVSTGLYLLNGQNAEVSLSEAATHAGLKVRPEHPPPTSQNLRAAALIQLTAVPPAAQDGRVRPFCRCHRRSG